MPPRKRQGPKTRSRGPVTLHAPASKQLPKAKKSSKDRSNRAQNASVSSQRPSRTERLPPVRFRIPEVASFASPSGLPSDPPTPTPSQPSQATRLPTQSVTEIVERGDVVDVVDIESGGIEEIEYPIDVSVRMYIGKTCEKRKDLASSTNVQLLDLSDFEAEITKELDPLRIEKRLSALELVRRSVSIRSLRKTQKSVDFSCFDLREAEHLAAEVDQVHAKHPRAKIELVWEIYAVGHTSKRRRERERSYDESSSLPATPGTGKGGRR